MLKPLFRLSMSLGLALGLTASPVAVLGLQGNAWALSSVDELTDVRADHWAYETLKDLTERYGVIEGYPDMTFRGNRVPTRWEMAAALNDLLRSIGRDMARLGAEKANKQDLEMLVRLQREFQQELAGLQARTDMLEARASAIEAKNDEQDDRLTLLEKTQIHGDFTIGGLADIGANGTGPENDGIKDGISSVGRLRLTMDIPVREDSEDSKWGAGTLSTRVIAAMGKFARNGSNPGNLGSDYPFNLYSRVSADVEGNNQGIQTGGTTPFFSGGANTRLNTYIETLFYKQHVKPGVPMLSDWLVADPQKKDWETSGDMYTGVVRWWDLFDVSPYRGNEQTQFQNNAFINIPGIAANISQPMVAYQWHQGLGEFASADLGTGIGSFDAGDAMGGLNLTYEGRLNYNTGGMFKSWAVPGSVYAGAYHLWTAGNTNITQDLATLTNRSGGKYSHLGDDFGGSAFYAGWNQEWYKGIGTSVGYLLNNRSGNIAALTTFQPGPGAVWTSARQSLSSVMHIPMGLFTAGCRANDDIGLGYAFVDLHEGGLSGNEFGDALEHVMEAYYRWQVNDAISVIPSFQLIANPLGIKANNIVTVFGLRMSVSF
ncbi:MAG: iron uptake porin [Candidatus Melainabacteria bacterium]